jgi:DNA-binding XRE family transcriptional regulator
VADNTILRLANGQKSNKPHSLLHHLNGDPSLPRKPSFPRYLRDARIKRGLSVTDIAYEIGVSTSSVYFWETDYCRPRDANLTALCKVLKLPIRATRALAAA